MEELFRKILGSVVDTAVNAGINTLITGQDYGDALKQTAGLSLLGSVLGGGSQKPSIIDLFQKQQQETQQQQQQQQAAPTLTPEQIRRARAAANEMGMSEQEAIKTMYSPAPEQNQGITSIGGADNRGFFESIGDAITGDEEGGRMGAIKQAFLPDSAGDPSPLRQYGPLGILGLLAAYKTGAFDPVVPERQQPYGGIGGMAGLQAKYPGTYRPGVPQIARPAGMADGGFPRKTGAISGPGTETSDDIPAMLSDGEFVMTARAVRGAGNGDREAGIRRMYDIMNGFERSVA